MENGTKELIEVCSGAPISYSLEAGNVYQSLRETFEKEEIRTIAEILISLATSPNFYND